MITFTFPIFTGFTLEKSIDIASLQKRISYHYLSLTRKELIYDIISLYLKALSLKKQKQAIKKEEKALEKLNDILKIGVKNGTFAGVDQMKVVYELSKVRAQKDAIKNSLDDVKASLLSLIGENYREFSLKNIQLNDNLINKSYNYKELLGKALKYQDQIKISKELVNISKNKLFIAKGEMLPKVYFFYNYGRSIGGGYSEPLFYYGINASMPIFDFGKSFFNILQAKNNLLAQKEKERTKILETELNIKKAINTFNTSKINLLAAKKELSYAKKVKDIENLKYLNGAGDMYDLLISIANYYNALASYYDSFYGLLSSEYLINYEVGDISYEKK